MRSWTVMCLLVDWLKASRHLIRTARRVLLDSVRLVALTCRSRSAVEAENLFLLPPIPINQGWASLPKEAQEDRRDRRPRNDHRGCTRYNRRKGSLEWFLE